jgi:hypothetical protein
MATIDFNEIFQELKNAVELFAKQKVSDYWKEAVGDADQFFAQTKDQLERWTTRLAKGELTADDFEWLVKGKKDLAEMKLLKQAGVTLIRVDEFKAGLLDVIVKTVVGKIP